MVSPTGHCRPFDVRSDGTIFGSGVGVVVLKALQDAVDDGDRIHAVIRGSALNNDGSTKMTYAAPNRGRPGRRHRRGARDRRGRRFDDQLRRDARNRHAAGRPDRDRRSAAGFRGFREDPCCSMFHRLGQVQHRSPGVGGRNREPDQGDSVPEAPGDSGDAALHQPQPRTASRTWTVRGAQRVRSVGMGRCAARRCQLVRRRWHQRARRAGRGANRSGVDTAARSAGAAAVRSQLRRAAAVPRGPGRRNLRRRPAEPD